MTKEALNRLSTLIIVDKQSLERKPTSEELEKMLALCIKRGNPSYYKLRHSAGLGEEVHFKGINFYSDNGSKMRRFKSGITRQIIRKATLKDAEALSVLVLSLSSFWEENPESLKKTFTKESFENQFQDKRSHNLFLLEEEGVIRAYISLLNETHLYHLFVDEMAQGKGFGQKLWSYVFEHFPTSYTVNASLSSVGFYKKQGFVATALEQENRGVSFLPMGFGL